VIRSYSQLISVSLDVSVMEFHVDIES